MKSNLVKIGVAAIGLAWAGPALAGGYAYIKHVKPIAQKAIKNPYRRKGRGKKRLEGCGPVAAASVLGYWSTERRYRHAMLTADRFNGTAHPSKTIHWFVKKSKTRRSPARSKVNGKKSTHMAYTLPGRVKRTLKKRCDAANKVRGRKSKLSAKRSISLVRWKKRKAKLTSCLRNGWPVILLFKNIPAGLSGKNKRTWGWHYVVAVGYSDAKKELYLISGWEEMNKSTSSSARVHKRRSVSSDAAHIAITYKELRKTRFGMVWIQGAKYKCGSTGKTKPKRRKRRTRRRKK